MHKDEAERQAVRAGIGPLAHCPPLDDFDIHAETRWNVEAALAWIIWRDSKSVLQFYNPYRKRCREWREIKVCTPTQPAYQGKNEFPPLPSGSRRVPPPIKRLVPPIDPARFNQGWALERPGDASLRQVEEGSAGRGYQVAVQPILSFGEALANLIQALKSGRLTAVGYLVSCSEIVEIPAFEWEGLEPQRFTPKGTSTVFKLEGNARYRNVMLPSGYVTRIWPINAPSREEPDHEKQWQAALQYFNSRIQEWHDRGIRPTRNEMERELRLHFGMSSTRARLLWEANCPDDWRKRGPRSKTPD